MPTKRISRRRILGGTLGGFFALAQRQNLAHLLAADSKPKAKANRIVVLWMNGGPSQFETFDPKPGTGTGGEAESIETLTPGLRISNFLPEVAKQMNRLSVVRNLTSKEGEHERAQYYMHTGYPLAGAFPRPALGSIVSHEGPTSDIPACVSLGSRGFGPAYLGPEHAPFSIEDPADALDLLTGLRRRRGRLQFLQELGSEFDRLHSGDVLARRRGMVSRIERLMDTPFARALNVERESKSVREKYGDEFGRRCLTARRLLEAGVRFVEVQHDGWDTHTNNHNSVRDLCQAIDRPWATLMDELQASGMLDDTIVLWMGEFGRTPRINPQAGRDHFPQVTPVVIGGGGLKTQQIVGATNSNGTAIEGESRGIADLFATLMSQLGIDPATEYRTRFDSPATATDGGTPIAELI